MPYPDYLLQLQDDITDCLNGDFQFTNIPFASWRKLVISEEISRRVPHLVGKNGKMGIGGIILMPTIIGESPNIAVGQTEAQCFIDIVEQPEINFAADKGVQSSCEQIARQVRAVLQPLAFIGNAGLVGTFTFNDGEPVIPPIPDVDKLYPGCTGYRVSLRIKFSEAPLTKVAAPSIAWTGDTFTLTNNTAGATIYYTTDGSWPGPGNFGTKQDGTQGTAVQGTTATVASGTFLRYAAYLAGATGSDIGQTTAP